MTVGESMGMSWPGDWMPEKIAMTRRMGTYKTSMQIDRQAGRKMEVEAILGEPLRQAIRAGVSTPLLSMLYRLVRVVDAGQPA